MKLNKWIVGMIVAAVVSIGVLFQNPFAHAATEQKPIMVGFFTPEATQHSSGWRLHPSYYQTLVKNGMQGDLTELNTLYSVGNLKPGQLYDQIKGFDVVVLGNPNEGIHNAPTEQQRENLQIAGADLKRYVNEGGGLFLMPQAERYPSSYDEEYFNLLLQEFGAKMLHEGVFDSKHTFESKPTLLFAPMKFFWTKNIKPHPVTKGVRGLALPITGSADPAPGVAAIGLGNDWQVVIAGEITAQSYQEDNSNVMQLDKPGTQLSAPPIAAVRTLGKGRVFIYNVSPRNAFTNYGNRLWPQVTESIGDPAKGWPSDGNMLLLNALRWLAQPALQNPALGAYQLPPIEPVTFNPSVNWDDNQWSTRETPGYPGLIGAHSNYTDGSGTVADYAKAAKAAGLSYIVFADPLEMLTEEEFNKLKADCVAATKEYGVYVCPGVEYTDSLGVRWATWGENIVWPETSFTDSGKTFPQWNGKTMFSAARYDYVCGMAPNAIIDYSALRKANASPGNLWFYFRVFPFAYDENKLIADNLHAYLYALRDQRILRMDAFNRLRSPSQVAQAAQTCLGYYTVDVPQNLSTRAATGTGSVSVSQGGLNGPHILEWEATNTQMENPWWITRGAQRVRLHFTVSAQAGIAQVIVHDGDVGVVRRYDGHGAKTFSREFEMVQDNEHFPVLEVIDANGNKAISTNGRIFCYKSSMWRTGDNLNILGAALTWHPDRNEMPSISKVFENYPKYTVGGFDTGSGVVSKPQLVAMEGVSTTEGVFPPSDNTELTNKVPDFLLESHDIQIYSTKMDQRAEGYDTAKRPTPAMGPISRRLGPLPYTVRSQTTYAPASKADYFTIWNRRRIFEGLKGYQGDIVLTKGEIRFTKDVTLKGTVPVPLVYVIGHGGAKYGQYDRFYVTDQDKGRIAVQLHPDQKEQLVQSGTIATGGYCAALNTDLGYYAFYAPPGSNLTQFTYSTEGSTDNPGLVQGPTIGLGHDGQQVKAGTVWKFKFAIANIADPESTDDTLIKDIARGLNLDGKQGGYPYELQTGKFVSDQYFFTVKAVDNEAQFSLGPRHEIIKLPIRVMGLEDNGCAANFVKSRGFFVFVPVVGDTAYFQEPIDGGTQMWVGNPFVCDDKDVKITLVVDGQAPGKAPLLEVHNPTTKVLSTRIYSPKHTPMFGGMSATVQLPAGDSVFYRIENKKLVKSEAP